MLRNVCHYNVHQELKTLQSLATEVPPFLPLHAINTVHSFITLTIWFLRIVISIPWLHQLEYYESLFYFVHLFSKYRKNNEYSIFIFNTFSLTKNSLKVIHRSEICTYFEEIYLYEKIHTFSNFSLHFL